MLKKNKRLLSAVLIIVIFLAFFAKKSFIITLKTENGKNISPDFVFKAENWHNPKLELLRQNEKIDKIIASGDTEFQKILNLRHWVHRQWISGNDFYYPPWDALLILDLARKLNNRGFCAQYAIVFLQACLSVGIPARYIDLPGHFTVEVWSDDYGKWIIMDPANDLYFERNGIPLNGLELNKAYWAHSFEDIYEVKSSTLSKESGFTRRPVTRDEISTYRIYSIIKRNNQLSEPVTVERPKAGPGKSKLLPLPDFRNYPHISRESLTILEEALAYKNSMAKELPSDRELTENVSDFEYYVNQTIIQIADKNSKKGEVEIVLIAINPATFRNFLVETDSSGYKKSDNVLIWKLNPGRNVLKARLETSFGWKGPENKLVLFYKPAIF